MAATTHRPTRIIRKKRRALLSRYDEDDLHRLRVELRRIRSILKRQTGGKARRLRRDLGDIADATSAARDWDTLRARASRDIDQHTFRLLEPELERRRRHAHKRALRVLQAGKSSSVLKKVDRFLVAHTRSGNSHNSRKAVDRAIAGVADAENKAVAAQTPAKWHKLRIAIKELHYTLDTGAGPSSVPHYAAMLAQCKRLQFLLGQWHDTEVHRQTVQALLTSLDPKLSSQVSGPLLAWSRSLESEGRACLEEARTGLGPVTQGITGAGHD
ncbi:MAG: CHAD domain-containing protein [Halioglobus sp.]|nr:CHAD domain-containing protein [Halioglobus sp.]